ncbi:hypothetical protein PENSPDRAFT_759762 [Peniophora sp. CONT]|nr:hypothetical protein PENSPDRAFT_759762 [Peniophora sp. CONT]
MHMYSTCPRPLEAPALPYLSRALVLEKHRGSSTCALAIIEMPGVGDRFELCSSSSPDALLLYHPLKNGVDDARNYNGIQFTLELYSAHIRELFPYLTNTLILTMMRWQSSSQLDLLPFVHVRHLTLSSTNLHATIPLLKVQGNDESSIIALPSLTSLSIGGHVIWDFISSRPNTVETHAVRLRRALGSRARAGKSVSSIFVHFKEELEEVRAGNWDRTSCSKYLKNVETTVREGLEELFAIDGLRVVSYNSVYVLNEDGLTGRLVERSV